jgi:predicted nucleotidyltransferase
MRITTSEISNLLNSIKCFDEDADVYLFGSRIDDNKRGGDIDIAILSDKIDLKKKIDIKFNFFNDFGEQKLDIVIIDNENQPFWQYIKEKAILLSN